MKKILLMVLLLAVTVNAFSQRRRSYRRSYARSSQWYIMPKGGFNIATVTNWGGDVRLGLAVGGELGCRVSDVVTLSGSLIYSQQGTNTWFYSRDYRTDIHLDYLNLPFMVHFNVAPGLELKVGLQPGILVNDAVTLRTDGYSYDEDFHRSMKRLHWDDGYIESVDLSMPFAISYQYRQLVFEARYNLGLNNVTTRSWWRNGHNSVFQFTVGYKFDL